MWLVFDQPNVAFAQNPTPAALSNQTTIGPAPLPTSPQESGSDALTFLGVIVALLLGSIGLLGFCLVWDRQQTSDKKPKDPKLPRNFN